MCSRGWSERDARASSERNPWGGAVLRSEPREGRKACSACAPGFRICRPSGAREEGRRMCGGGAVFHGFRPRSATFTRGYMRWPRWGQEGSGRSRWGRNCESTGSGRKGAAPDVLAPKEPSCVATGGAAFRRGTRGKVAHPQRSPVRGERRVTAHGWEMREVCRPSGAQEKKEEGVGGCRFLRVPLARSGLRSTRSYKRASHWDALTKRPEYLTLPPIYSRIWIHSSPINCSELHDSIDKYVISQELDL